MLRVLLTDNDEDNSPNILNDKNFQASSVQLSKIMFILFKNLL